MNINIRPEILEIEAKIISLRRDIHKHPELAFNEFRTANLVAENLDKMGLEIQKI